MGFEPSAFGTIKSVTRTETSEVYTKYAARRNLRNIKLVTRKMEREKFLYNVSINENRY